MNVEVKSIKRFVLMPIKLLIALCSVLLLTSCFQSGCVKVDLTHEEKSWFDVYSKNKTVVFKSNLGNIDTFEVVDIGGTYTQCNRFELGEFQYNRMACILKPKNCHELDDSKCRCMMNFEKEEAGKDCLKDFKVLGLRNLLKSEGDTLINQTIKLNGKNYETFLFLEYVSAMNSGRRYLKSFNWSKEHGLLRYETVKGEVFEFYRKW